MLFKLAARVIIPLAVVSMLSAGPGDLRGVWEAQTYRLKSGQEHAVRGLIFFSEENWTVLFFVLDGQAEAKRASAEGGTYKTVEDRLNFTHLYNFSQGETLPGLAASPLRMEIHQAAEASTEPCRFQIQDDRLTLFFPSGNSMEFRRGR